MCLEMARFQWAREEEEEEENPGRWVMWARSFHAVTSEVVMHNR